MLRAPEGATPSEALAALPQWYVLACSGGLRRAATSHIRAEADLMRHAPWLDEAARSLAAAAAGATNTDTTVTAGGFAVPPASALAVSGGGSRGAVALAKIGGLVGDGSFASERLTAAEAQFRGVDPVSAYALSLSERRGGGAPAIPRPGSAAAVKSHGSPLNNTYFTRPSTAAKKKTDAMRSGAPRDASYHESTQQSFASTAGGASPTSPSRRFLHLDETGSSKRLPIIIAAPSFTADPRDVAAAGTQFAHSLGGATSSSAAATSPSHDTSSSNSAAPRLAPTLLQVPIRRAQHSSGRRELLLQKAHTIATIIGSGQLYVSPVTGEAAAWRSTAGAGNGFQSPHRKSANGNANGNMTTATFPPSVPRSPHNYTSHGGVSPPQSTAPNVSSLSPIGLRNYGSRPTSAHPSLAIGGLTVTAATAADASSGLVIPLPPPSGAGLIASAAERGGGTKGSAAEALSVMGVAASAVVSTIAPATAALLLQPLQDDFGAVRIACRDYSVVPAAAASAQRVAAAAADVAEGGAVDGKSSVTPSPPTTADVAVPIRSYEITAAVASDALVGLARREISSIDEAAARLEDGDVEYRRKRDAREEAARRLFSGGVEEKSDKVEGRSEGGANLFPGGEGEADENNVLPALSGSCRMVALRSALGFGLDGVGSEGGLRDEIAALVSRGGASTSPTPSPRTAPLSSPHHHSSPLGAVVAWAWQAFRWADDRLAADHLPPTLASTVRAGETAADRREAEAQRTATVSSVIVEAFLALSIDTFLGGAAEDSPSNDSPTGAQSRRDGFGLPTTGPAFSPLAMTAHAAAPIPSQVRRYSAPTTGYVDRRHVLLNSARLLMALREVLGPVLATLPTSPSSPSTSTGAKSNANAKKESAAEGTEESGTELIYDDDSDDDEKEKAKAAEDDQLALLLLVLFSRVPLPEVVATAALLMRPLWDSLTKAPASHSPSNSPLQQHQQQRLGHMQYQSSPLSPSGTYDPPFVDLSAVCPATAGGGMPPHSPPKTQQQRPHTMGGGGTVATSGRIGRSSSSHQRRPDSASSLRHLLAGGETSATANTGGHRPAALVAEEILARRQREEEAAAGAGASPFAPFRASSIGVTVRDPITRVSRDEYNLERVLMSRLSRRMVTSALEGSDLGAGGDTVNSQQHEAFAAAAAAAAVGGCSSATSPHQQQRQRAASLPSHLQRPPTPDGPSSLTKHLGDLHVRPAIPSAPTPINSSLTASPNRLGLGGSTRNNALPPFMVDAEPTTYRSVRAYNEPTTSALLLSAKQKQQQQESASPSSHHQSMYRQPSPAPVSNDASMATTSPTTADSHFVRYLQRGIISAPYRKQLAKANPFAMATLQRAAEVAAATAGEGGGGGGGGHLSESLAVEAAVFGSPTANASSPNALALREVFDRHTVGGGDEENANEDGADAVEEAAAAAVVSGYDATLSVRLPQKGYLCPTRRLSATRQQHFKNIQENLLDPLEAANSGGKSRPTSAALAASQAHTTVITRSRPSSSSPQRPRSGNFFSRTPKGFDTSFVMSAPADTSSDAAALTTSSPQQQQQQALPPTRAHMLGNTGAVLIRRDAPYSGTSPERVVVGSNLGETPNEVARIDSRATSPQPPPSPSSAAALITSATGGRGSVTIASGDESSDALGPLSKGTVRDHPRSPTPPDFSTAATKGKSPQQTQGSTAQFAVGAAVPTGPPTTAPSIPSPARRRFGLPVRDVDRAIAAREAEARSSGGGHSQQQQQQRRAASASQSSTAASAAPKTQRAHPRVITDLSGYAAGSGGPSSPPARLSHRPVSATQRGPSPLAGDGSSGNAAAAGAILLVPQMAALPITSGGSFSQRLSKGFLTSPSGRHKRF